MVTVNMHEAKSSLSKLVEAVENGSETEIILARNGKPAAKIVSLAAETRLPRRLGLAKGKYAQFSLEAFNAADEDIAQMFYGDDLKAIDAKVDATRKRLKAGKS